MMIRPVVSSALTENPLTQKYQDAADAGTFRVFFNPGNGYTKCIFADRPNEIRLMPSRITLLNEADEFAYGRDMHILRTPLGEANTRFASGSKWIIDEEGITPYDQRMNGKPGVCVMLLLSVCVDRLMACEQDDITLEVVIQIDKLASYEDQLKKKLNNVYVFEHQGVQKTVTVKMIRARNEGDHLASGDDLDKFSASNSIVFDLGGNTVIFRHYKGNRPSKPIALADRGASYLLETIVQDYATLIGRSQSEVAAQRFIMDRKRFASLNSDSEEYAIATQKFADCCARYMDEVISEFQKRYANTIASADNIYIVGGLACCDTIVDAFKAHPVVGKKGKVFRNPQVADMVHMAELGYVVDIEAIENAAIEAPKLREAAAQKIAAAEMKRLMHG